MEDRIKEYLVYFLAKQKRLIRLLQLTKDNKSEIVQELRKEVREYVNETEKYISSLEMGFIAYWGSEEGWKNKKAKKSKTIDWKSTIIKTIKLNAVYY